MSDEKSDYGISGSMSAGVSYGQQGVTNVAPQETNTTPLDLGITASVAPIKDISTAEFINEVIDASSQVPVLVDFWAPWCEPCKQLTPVLEAAVTAAGGSVKLVKMNIDDHPEIAGKMGIQSIPAVVAFVDGKPLDAMQGNKSASEVKAFIEKVGGPSGPSQLDQILQEAADLMEQNSFQEAGQLYSAILQQIPDNIEAIAGLGTALLNLGDIDAAKDVLANVEDYEKEAPLKALASAIELEEQASDVGNITELAEALAKDTKNHQARVDLAIALNARGSREDAADHLLEIIKTDRKWQDDGAKAQLLKFFEAWGPMDEATLVARRKLSSILFS